MSRGMTMTEAEYRALLARTGDTHAPRPRHPALPSLQAPYPESPFYAALQQVGQEHGWLDECSWLPHGEDQGLCCWLVRPPELLYALIRRPGQALTPGQRRWLSALRETSAEVVEWQSDEVDVMTERLSRKAQTGTLASKTRLGCPSAQKGAHDEHI